ncbi:hypothetical protein EVC02_036 [Rhizobium phage RHph_N17]|nr:hypothetical protein EVC02_036 [Rhizobium phage RHph_N17]
MSEPPIYTQKDLHTWVTLEDVFDAHEALDLKGAMSEKAARDAELQKNKR